MNRGLAIAGVLGLVLVALSARSSSAATSAAQPASTRVALDGSAPLSGARLVDLWEGPTLSDSQIEVLDYIQDRIEPMWGLAVAAGAAINSYLESQFNPYARSPGSENSVGIWQLNNAKKAAGAGMSDAERQNIETATDRILSVAAGGFGSYLPLEAADAAAYLWCWHVEVPAYHATAPPADSTQARTWGTNPYTGQLRNESDYRAYRARTWFPSFPKSYPDNPNGGGIA